MRHAILIGCEKYTNFNDTRFAHNDVDLMFETLTTYCDFQPENVLKYKLSEDSGIKPQDILDGVESFSSKTITGNTILFYFAGHGHRTADGTYLLLPSTTRNELEDTSLNLDKLASTLRQDGKSCIRIFDACHSGADVRDAAETDVENDEFLRSITTDNSGWVTLAGCAPKQKSYSDPSIGHGIFTYYLCEEIRGISSGKPVYPEMIKVPIVENVYKHAIKLGFEQTPTLNASISGNLTIATRKEPANDTAPTDVSPTAIRARISELEKITEITDSYLNDVLSSLVISCKAMFAKIEFIDTEGEDKSPETIDYIPEGVKEIFVRFVEGQTFTSRHTLKTVRKYKQRSLMDHAFVPKELESKNYVTEQPSFSPESVVQIRFSGDKRCLPDIVVFLYVIPLQISTCNLISVWNYGWDDSFTPMHIHNYYENKRVDEPLKVANSVVEFAATRFAGELQTLVQSRISSLERELSDTK